MCVRVCAYLCIWPYDWCLCVFGVCVYEYQLLMYVCVCVCCVMINDFVCLCILRYDWCLCVFVCLLTSLSCRGWIGWLCRTALVNFQTTCLLPQFPYHTLTSNSNTQTSEDLNIFTSRPHAFSPSSHLPSHTQSQIQTLRLKTLKHLKIQTF